MTEQTLPQVKPNNDNEMMPLLPLRDVVVYPHLVIPLFVGRTKSVKALEIASDTNKQILLVRGLPQSLKNIEHKNCIIKNHLVGNDLQNAINSSNIIACRST